MKGVFSHMLLSILFGTCMVFIVVPSIGHALTISGNNVGIGTNTPSQPLEVNGNIKITGIGDVLMLPDGTSMSSTTNFVDLSTNQTIGGTKTFSNTIIGNISGNAANVTGTVGIANGGTGATTASGARTSLGTAARGANSDITSLSGLTTPLSVSQGGTGSGTQNFVDLSTTQTVTGSKTLNNLILGGDLRTDRWLNSNTNTFIGVGVAGFGHLTHNTGNQGWNNTALGYNALYANITGDRNTAIGNSALSANTTGYANTATGETALLYNNAGYENTAAGVAALYYNTSGYDNVAIGDGALIYNTIGYENTATGHHALFSNSEGYDNTAIGYEALNSNTFGTYNTAVGYRAGSQEVNGGYNIYIGANVQGASDDYNVIRIGSGQTQTYIAGIYLAQLFQSYAEVFVDNNGQLGTIASSRRFKEDIKDMGVASSQLMKLRPVTFRYRTEVSQEKRLLQYGLIAEEVAEVYPELVQYGNTGEPLTVRYHELGPMLLNEVQKQQKQIQQLTQKLNEKDAHIEKLEKALEAMEKRLAAIETPAKTVALK